MGAGLLGTGSGFGPPALRTTARRDGDEYIVNGQKVWTPHAGISDIIFTLVRTGTRESRNKGITYLLIDAHAPGVQVRPLRDLTGGATSPRSSSKMSGCR